MERFQILEKLAEGGMGEIYRAHQTALGREVALKMLIAADLADDSHMVRFQREVKLLASFAHPHIVRVYECGFFEGKPYFTMELILGRDLEAALEEEGPLRPARALEIWIQIADAIAHLHDHGIVHRDLKPRNLILEKRGDKDHIVLIDFGLARAATGTLITRAGEMIGTLPFMPPEALRGEETGPAGDVWALGVTAFQLLTGARLFRSQTPGMVMTQIVDFKPATLPGKLDGAPGWFLELLAVSLAPEPTRRPTARDLHHRLVEARSRAKSEPGRPLKIALRQGRAPADATDLATTPRDPTKPPLPGTRDDPVGRTGSRWRRRAPALAVTFITALVGFGGLAAIFRPPAREPAAASLFRPAELAGLDEVLLPAARTLAPDVTLRLAKVVPEPAGDATLPVIQVTRLTTGGLLVRGLPPESRCLLTPCDARGDRAGPDVEVSTPPRHALAAATVVAGDSLVQLTIHRLQVPLVVEVRSDRAVEWSRAGVLRPGAPVRSIEIEGLNPSTRYWIRARVADGWGGLGPLLVETRDVSHGKLVRTMVQRVARRLDPQDEMNLELALSGVGVDSRIGPALVAYMQDREEIPQSLMMALARRAAELNEPALAANLDDRYDSITDGVTRVRILEAMAQGGHPRTVDRIVEELRAHPGLHHAPFLVQLLLLTGTRLGPGHFDLIRTVTPRGAEGVVAAGLRKADPSRALRLLEDWLLRPRRAGEADEAALAFLTAPAADWHRLLAAAPREPEGWIFTTIAAMRQDPDCCAQVAGRTGALERLIPGGEICPATLAAIDDPEAWNPRTIPLLADVPAARSRLESLLASPEAPVAEAAAWALARAGGREAIPALMKVTDSSGDPRGVFLWSLARLGAREAEPAVLRRLGTPDAGTPEEVARLGMAAWAAEELATDAARPLLEAIRARRYPDSDFLMYSVRRALESLAGAPRGRSELLLPHTAALHLERSLLPGESRRFRSCAFLPGRMETPRSDPQEDRDFHLILGSIRHWIPPNELQLIANADDHGRLVLTRSWPPRDEPGKRGYFRVDWE